MKIWDQDNKYFSSICKGILWRNRQSPPYNFRESIKEVFGIMGPFFLQPIAQNLTWQL